MDEDTGSKKISPQLLWKIVAGVVVVIALGMVVSKINSSRKAQAARAAQAAQLRETLRLKAEEVKKQENTAWENAQRQVVKLRASKHYDAAIKLLREFIKAHPDAESVAAAKSQIQETQKAIKAMAKDKERRTADILKALEAKSEAFIQKGEFDKAVNVYKHYSGELATETAKAREDLLKKCKVQIRQAKYHAKRKAQSERDAFLEALSKELIEGKFKTALSKFEHAQSTKSSPTDEVFSKDTSKSLRQLASVNKIIRDSFKADIKKKIAVKLKTGHTVSGILIKVNDKGKLLVKVPKGKASYVVTTVDLGNLAISEKYKRASKYMVPDAAAIYFVACAVAGKKFDLAEEKVADTGVFATAISRLVADMSEKATALKRTAGPNSKVAGGGPPPLIPPVMAAHRLYWFAAGLRIRDQLAGKTVTVTGMVNQVSNDPQGLKIELYNGRVVCHAPQMSGLPIKQFYDTQKKLKHNKRNDFHSFLIKATIRGVVKPAKAGAVNLEKAEIVNWYGVEVLYQGAFLEFNIEAEPSGGTITNYREPLKSKSVDVTGFLDTFQDRGAKLLMKVGKKWNLTIGNDPLSLATEARQIYTIMCKKGFRSALKLTIKAEDDNAKMKLLKNASIVDWKATGGAIALYPIQNYISDSVTLSESNALK